MTIRTKNSTYTFDPQSGILSGGRLMEKFRRSELRAVTEMQDGQIILTTGRRAIFQITEPGFENMLWTSPVRKIIG